MGKNHSNAILLLSILKIQKDYSSIMPHELVTELTNIIAFVDYIDHAIMTYDEFNNGLKYLLKNKFIREKNKKIIIVRNVFKKWYTNILKDDKQISLLREVEIIENYLNKLDENDIIGNEIEINVKIDRNDFEESVKSYIVTK
jgi:hypothetical protein